jgi:hypothetical protein
MVLSEKVFVRDVNLHMGLHMVFVETALSKSRGESPLPEYLVYAPYAFYLCFAAFSLLNEIFTGIARGFR